MPAKHFSSPGASVVTVSSKNKNPTPRQLTQAEQEVQTAAERLAAQVEDALAAVAVQTFDSTEELEACADRLERVARDMTVALRELARQRGRGGPEQ